MAGIFFIIAIVFLGFILIKLIGNVIKGLLSLIGIVAVICIILVLFISSDYSSLNNLSNTTRVYYFEEKEGVLSTGFMANATKITYFSEETLASASQKYKNKKYSELLFGARRVFIFSEKAFSKDTYIISGEKFKKTDVIGCIKDGICTKFEFLNTKEDVTGSFVFEKAYLVQIGNAEHSFLLMESIKGNVFAWPQTSLFKITNII
ncbi:MAG: hypothetical protein V1859_00530 [archaeon]